MNNPFIMGVAAAVTFFTVTAIASNIRDKREFMEECQRHQPKYQCTVLWRESQPTTVNVYGKD